MIDTTKPIWKDEAGRFFVYVNGSGFWVQEEHQPGLYTEVTAYLAEHPEALVDEPVPPPPTPEQIAEQERQVNMSYLASTDWYATRLAETGKAVPADIKAARQKARDAL